MREKLIAEVTRDGAARRYAGSGRLFISRAGSSYAAANFLFGRPPLMSFQYPPRASSPPPPTLMSFSLRRAASFRSRPTRRLTLTHSHSLSLSPSLSPPFHFDTRASHFPSAMLRGLGLPYFQHIAIGPRKRKNIPSSFPRLPRERLHIRTRCETILIFNRNEIVGWPTRGRGKPRCEVASEFTRAGRIIRARVSR